MHLTDLVFTFVGIALIYETLKLELDLKHAKILSLEVKYFNTPPKKKVIHWAT